MRVIFERHKVRMRAYFEAEAKRRCDKYKEISNKRAAQVYEIIEREILRKLNQN